LVLCTLLTRFVHNARRSARPHAPWGPRVHTFVKLRARPSLHCNCTIDDVLGARGSAGAHRALVHRVRPRGWAHVACAGGRTRPPEPRGPPASRSPGGRGRRQPHTRTVWRCCFRTPTPPPGPCARERGRRPRRSGRTTHHPVGAHDEPQCARTRQGPGGVGRRGTRRPSHGTRNVNSTEPSPGS
jgi:hypothetical protein